MSIKKVYIVTAYDLVHGYTTEHRVFTSKDKAKKSCKALIQHLMTKNNIHNVSYTNVIAFDDSQVYILGDDQFNVSMVDYNISTMVSVYDTE
jgi:hypothetical protein